MSDTCAGISKKSLNISSSISSNNVPISPTEKRIRIKTKPGLIPAIPQAPVVILKNVSDIIVIFLKLSMMNLQHALDPGKKCQNDDKIS